MSLSGLSPKQIDTKVHIPHLDYFPKIRILFCFIYVALTIAFFISNLMSGRVRTDDAIELVLGGVGEIINSVILIIQLLVLRFELLK